MIELSYYGTNYCGWQRQDNAATIQNCIDENLSVLLREKIKTTGSSRTDAGVHAKMQFAHFDILKEIQEIKKFIYSINALLPNDIAINNCWLVSSNFHARFNAIKRTYDYQIIYNKDPFLYNNTILSHKELNLERLNKIAKIFQRTNLDCRYISKKTTDQQNFFCSIYEAYWTKNDKVVIFTITANRFLRGMIRIIVSLSIEIMNEFYRLEDLDHVLTQTKQIKLPKLVPAKGLTLKKIEYEKLEENIV